MKLMLILQLASFAVLSLILFSPVEIQDLPLIQAVFYGVGIVWLFFCFLGLLLSLALLIPALLLSGGGFFWPDSVPDGLFWAVLFALPTLLSVGLNFLLAWWYPRWKRKHVEE